MPIMNTSIGGSAPTATINITSNGSHDVTAYGTANVQVPTTAPDHYLEWTVDGSGVLQRPTTMMNMSGITKVGARAFYNLYNGNSNISGPVDLSSVTEVNSLSFTSAFESTGITSVNLSGLTNLNTGNPYSSFEYAFNNCSALTSFNLNNLTTMPSSSYGTFSSAFMSCNNLTSASFPSLISIPTSNGLYNCFIYCSGITSASFPVLTTISGDYSMAYCFSSCTSLTSIDLNSLTTISGEYSMAYCFNNCTSLTSIDLSSLTTISGSEAMQYCFGSCTSLNSVTLGGTTAISFGSYTNQFNSMFDSCSQNISVTAPAASRTTIEAMDGYPNFGGTGTVTWNWAS